MKKGQDNMSTIVINWKDIVKKDMCVYVQNLIWK